MPAVERRAEVIIPLVLIRQAFGSLNDSFSLGLKELVIILFTEPKAFKNNSRPKTKLIESFWLISEPTKIEIDRQKNLISVKWTSNIKNRQEYMANLVGKVLDSMNLVGFEIKSESNNSQRKLEIKLKKSDLISNACSIGTEMPQEALLKLYFSGTQNEELKPDEIALDKFLLAAKSAYETFNVECDYPFLWRVYQMAQNNRFDSYYRGYVRMPNFHKQRHLILINDAVLPISCHDTTATCDISIPVFGDKPLTQQKLLAEDVNLQHHSTLYYISRLIYQKNFIEAERACLALCRKI